MSKKQWFVLLCLYVLYLCAGAAIFLTVEVKEEEKRAVAEQEEKIRLEILLREHFQGNYSARKQLFSSLSDYCGKPLGTNMSDDPFQYRWDFYHALFFVITVVSTIGYGNLAPTTMFTRIFMIFYGLIGIPMNGIVVFTLGEFFSKSFTKLHQRWKNTKLEAKFDHEMAKIGLIGQVILYLVPGFTFFIFLPSTIMTVFEGWEYDVSVYYSFVSLTTIGFGDYVAGVTDTFSFGPLYMVYKIFLLVWIVGGMGYVAMILSFITHGMRSKHIKKIEHMLSENIKNTPKKIRAELRGIIHEMLFLRVKPVYKGEFDYIPNTLERTQSCPDLTMYKTKSPRMVRKRAMSECYRSVTMQKVQSDSDLNRIDKERTFLPTEDLFEKTDLLFKVVNALSDEPIETREENLRGVNGFSDQNILASETYEPGITQVQPKKRRAISDIRPPSKLLQEMSDNTWYGTDANDAINEYRKRMQRAKSVHQIKPGKTEKESGNFFKKIRDRLLSRDESNQDPEKQKIPDEMENIPSETPPNMLSTKRGSIVSDYQVENQVLEQTSIADLIRAISAITTPDTLENPEIRPETFSPKSRRQGIITQSRRASFIADAPQSQQNIRALRRFSLKPSDENLLLKDSTTRFKEKMRKISVTFQDERRNSLVLEASSTIPPTVEENEPFPSSAKEYSSERITKRFSNIRPGVSAVGDIGAPPPYSMYPSGSTGVPRKFSVRQVNVAGSNVSGPVQKQLHKRERTDSSSSGLGGSK